MDLRPKEGPKMQPAQHINTKEHKTTANQANNMNNSRSERRYSKSEPDFDYYVAKKFNSKSEKERDLYFQKLLEAFRTLSEEAPEVFDTIAPEMLQRSIWSWRGADPLLSKKFNNWPSTTFFPKRSHPSDRLRCLLLTQSTSMKRIIRSSNPSKTVSEGIRIAGMRRAEISL